MIRLATAEDFDALINLGMEAAASIPRYQGAIAPDRQAMTKLFETLYMNPAVFFPVLGPEGKPYGMMPSVVSIHPISGESTLCAYFWWVSPDHRGRGLDLLRAFFAWGETMGVSAYQIGGSSKRVAKLYKRYGFQLVEEIFMRRAKPRA